MPDAPVPTFLYIGASRAGSTWLCEVLNEHPDIFVPTAKDIMFFDRYYDKGFAWYTSFFNGTEHITQRGELSHDYFLSRTYAARIKQHLPNIKLLCCLREPADRAESIYRFNRTSTFMYGSNNKKPHEITFDEFCALPIMENQLDYVGNLTPFFELFPRENILVLFYEDLKKDPSLFVKTAYEFLGVDSSFLPKALHTIINENKPVRSVTIARFIYWVSQIVRRCGFQNIVGRVKRSSLFWRVLYSNNASKATSSAESRKHIQNRYRPHYDKLESLIQKKLPAEWYTA